MRKTIKGRDELAAHAVGAPPRFSLPRPYRSRRAPNSLAFVQPSTGGTVPPGETGNDLCFVLVGVYEPAAASV